MYIKNILNSCRIYVFAGIDFYITEKFDTSKSHTFNILNVRAHSE